MSSLSVEEDQRWVPTHVQVTVLRGRGLRGKGKHGTSDVYTIIQLGKEKYSTCVVEKTTEPEWKEECSFELQPGVLEGGGRSGYAAAGNELILTVMHRALIGLDVFLGQAVIPLDKVFSETRCVRNEWYRLNSKTGKKEKERGDIQVTVQFTRNNLTASMYDLVMKDKSASTFSKLKERMRGKRRSSDDDSSSAVLPGGYGSLVRMRHRLPSDGGGEEDYEDDEGGEARRSKMRTFFLRGKLRKSSDTRSSTSLGSESSESSSRGGSLSPTAGISVVVSDLSNSPSNSSNLTADNSPEHTTNTSPKSSSLKCEFGDEAGEISIPVPQPTVCINGSHAYSVQPPDPGSGKPAESLGLGLLQKTLPLSVSLQNLSPRSSTDLPKGVVGDGRRWSFDKPGEEEKAAITAALEKSGPMQGEEEEEEERLGHGVLPKAASTAELETQGKKQRRNLFSHGRSESAGRGQSQSRDASQQAPATEERHKGWFGYKDSHSKPSLVESPKLEPSTDPHPPPLPSSHHPPGPPVDPACLVSPLHHTNPFCHSQTSPPPISPCNPFFSVLQHNPFYGDMLTTQPAKPVPPPLPYLSSSRPPISQLFPQAKNPDPAPTHNIPTAEDSVSAAETKSGPTAKTERRPLPPTPTEGKRLSNPFKSVGELEPDSEWDDSFEAFAAGRLQPPGDGDPPADCTTQQHTPSGDGGAALPETGPDQAAPPHQPCRRVVSEALETIPELRGFESDDATLNADSTTPDACSETNRADSTTNTGHLTDTNTHPAPCPAPCPAPSTQLSSSSPDPGSSGLGSSAEEDFLSCLSSYSDKFSASSSSEEAEAQGYESNLDKSSDSAMAKSPKPSETEDDGSVDDVAQETVIQRGDGDDGVESPQLTAAAAETGSGGADTRALSVSDDPSPKLTPDLLPHTDVSPQDDEGDGERSVGELGGPLVGFSELAHVNSTPDDELSPTLPSVKVVTSSPDVGQQEQDSRCSPLTFGVFGDFLDAGPGCSSSFLHSLDVSVDSQVYQSCESHPASKCSSVSGPDETLHSANSTLLNGSSQGHATDPDAPTPMLNGETNRTDGFEEFEIRAAAKVETPEVDFVVGEDSGLLALAASPKDSDTDRQQVVPDDEFSTRPPGAQSAVFHRSHSEGALTAAFDQLLLPSFGSDPGAIRGSSSSSSSSARAGPDLPSLISFAPPLTPVSRSSPVALSSFPPLANASARSPPGTPEPEDAEQLEQQQRRRWWWWRQQQADGRHISPHPVKPLTTAMLAEEKRTEGRSVLATGLEKLKSTIHPGRSSQPSEQETDRKKSLTEGAGSYYHLTHSELVALLVQREAELDWRKEEFERQRVLLAKREVELKRLKPQVRDLEDYIDTLLVRIMEQKPTLLQVRSKFK